MDNKMKIYVAHSKKHDYQNELYRPLIHSLLGEKHEMVLPHLFSDEPFPSKEYISTCDLIIAEVSYPSIGMGIELGWANMLNIPILCIYRSENTSSSLKVITNNFIKYENERDLVIQLEKFIENFK